MPDLIEKWLSTEGFVLHGHSYPWTPELMWTCMIADAALGLAYYSISAALLYLVRKRHGLEFNWIYLMLSLTLLACGTMHLISVWTISHPSTWLNVSVRGVAAAAAAATAVMLWPLIPRILRLPSPARMRLAIDQLQHEIDERRKAEDALRQSQATLRELAAYQERIREDERKRIAREIHDELGQNLLALRLDVSALHARAGDRHPRLKERSETALEYIDTTMKSIRSIMNNLRPPVLDLGLHAAIEWQVAQFERRNGVLCEVAVSDEGFKVPEDEATAAFRILQESLNNIGRHARANFVRIEVHIEKERLKMVIKDDGVGMYPGDRRKTHRFGLLGMEERITMLGGEFDIDSAPGRGTVLRITIPMPQETSDMEPVRV